MDYEIKQVPPQNTLVFTRTFDTTKLDEMDYFGGLVFQAVAKSDAVLTGLPASINMPADEGTALEVTFYLPVDGAPETLPLDPAAYLVEPGDALRSAVVPGIPEAVTFRYEGSLESLMEQRADVQRWAAENGYRIARAFRSVLHRGPMHRMPDGRRVYPDEMIWEFQQEIYRAT